MLRSPRRLRLRDPFPTKTSSSYAKIFALERKQLIAINLPLTPSEAEKFWPVYDQYVSELVTNNDKKYALIKQYVQTGGVLTDAQADAAVGSNG